VWDVRCRVAPELGSGVGLRGDNLDRKRKWLGYALAEFAYKSVVDLGCGDIEVTRTLPLREYLGLDESAVAVDLARTKRPDWRFRRITDDAAALPEGDAVLCLDVLIHQKRARDFDGLLARLIEAARERLIVSGYNESPQITRNPANFHRPLIAALQESGTFSEISVIGRYKDSSLVVADKRPTGPVIHPNDMTADDFNYASLLTERPDLLRRLADLSRRSFGFYSKHFARALEYSWLAAKLESLAPGRRVLDIGAGLNPLPLFLAERGAIVECVDSHSLARVPPVDPNWNEWGFYNYGRDHPNLRAHNVGALSFAPAAPFDVIYSVSVIEHMPRKTWEATLGRCREWLGLEGRLLLTADLIPGTELLWNYAEGQEVEPPHVHGDTEALISWLERLGFTLSEWFFRREVPKRRPDLLFVDCSLA
jgi:SAM-dependent methyltransferase